MRHSATPTASTLPSNPQSADAEGSPARNALRGIPRPVEPATGGGNAERSEASSPGLVRIETSGPTRATSRFFDTPERRFSRMRRKVAASGDTHQGAANRHGLKPWFVTLTYAPENHWRGRHISDYCRELRRHFRGVVRYVWVAEIQAKRQARTGESSAHCLHYHVCIWLPRGIQPPKPDASGMWLWGWSQIERARRPVGYLLKYASKGGDVHLPRGARLCGSGGLERDGRLYVRWWLLPRYVRSQCRPGDNVHRSYGGGWVSLVSGEWWPPWDTPVPPLPNHLPESNAGRWVGQTCSAI